MRDGQGICQSRKWRTGAHKGEVIPWDGKVVKERHHPPAGDMTLHRHEEARLLCQRCPVLDACENYLSDMEKRGISVNGVVAGRYSDTPPGGWEKGPAKIPSADINEQQTTCRACREPMWPQITAPERVAKQGGRQHKGEGLCDLCHPRFARQVRKQ